jgi:hypothetical protein
MVVSGQLHTSRERIPRYPVNRRLGVPQSRSGRGGEEKNSQPLPGIEPQNPDRPARSPVGIRLRNKVLSSLANCLYGISVKIRNLEFGVTRFGWFILKGFEPLTAGSGTLRYHLSTEYAEETHCVWIRDENEHVDMNGIVTRTEEQGRLEGIWDVFWKLRLCVWPAPRWGE